jgi:hypothetical protein
MSRGKYINEETFNEVKYWLGKSLGLRDIARITGVSTSTIGRIESADDYQAYRTPVKTAVVTPPPAQAVPLEDVYTKLDHLEKKIDDLLARVEERLDKKKGIWR